MPAWHIQISAILFLAAFCPSNAATLKSSQLKDGRVVILISGELVEGDTEAFKSAVKTANDAGKLVSSIRLNSPGGSLLEGVKLADAVRFGKIVTNVGQGATCASACFLVFAAGSMKYANYSARIGVHGASDQSGQENARSGAATVSMARVAKELGVPAAIIGRMVVTPPSDMVWLSPSELQSMEVSLVGKPSQVAQPDQPPSRQTEATEPVDITPKARAAAKPPTWNEFVEKAVALSAQQNNGTPRTMRSCQPELKLCWNVVTFTNKDGFDTGAKVVKDMNDKIVLKEVCTFNATKDIRRCFNWDTEVVHRDMQDSSSNWTKIADD
jgi:hypothetical protein